MVTSFAGFDSVPRRNGSCRYYTAIESAVDVKRGKIPKYRKTFRQQALNKTGVVVRYGDSS